MTAVPLGWSGVPVAVDALAAAFLGYPLLRAIAPTDQRRGCESFCRVMVNYSVRLGQAYTTPDRSAVACWLPPGREWFSVPELIRSGAIAWVWQLGVGGTLLLERISRAFDAARAGHLTGAHWYLNLLGVHPEAQGRGLSRTVLRPVFDTADRTRTPCYLETQDGANVGLYRRLGFKLVGERRLPGGLRNWEMVRPPG